ncbi:MAG: hypothetical protein AB1746_09495, partial [Candidatus Zixiibacteriota bacterium]
MNIALPLCGLILFLMGAVLILRSMWLRKPNHPTVTGRKSWKYAIRPWRYKDMWEPTGFPLYISGYVF